VPAWAWRGLPRWVSFEREEREERRERREKREEKRKKRSSLFLPFPLFFFFFPSTTKTNRPHPLADHPGRPLGRPFAVGLDRRDREIHRPLRRLPVCDQGPAARLSRCEPEARSSVGRGREAGAPRGSEEGRKRKARRERSGRALELRRSFFLGPRRRRQGRQRRRLRLLGDFGKGRRHLGARRLWRPRRRGEDPGRRVRAHGQEALPGHLPGDAGKEFLFLFVLSLSRTTSRRRRRKKTRF